MQPDMVVIQASTLLQQSPVNKTETCIIADIIDILNTPHKPDCYTIFCEISYDIGQT